MWPFSFLALSVNAVLMFSGNDIARNTFASSNIKTLTHMTKMTIHRGLSELKLIDARIEKQTAELNPVAIYQEGKKINGTLTVEEFGKDAQSKYDSVTDLISRKHAIKSAIVAANASTDVKIGEKTMKIADAISFKASIPVKKALLNKLKSSLSSGIANLNRTNEVVQNNAKQLLEAAVGKDTSKVDETTISSIQGPYIKANEVHLADPIKVSEKIATLEKEIGDFEAELDAALSEINATTFIEV